MSRTAEELFLDAFDGMGRPGSGYRRHAHFVLPASDWKDYYMPVQANLKRMRTTYRDNPTAGEVITAMQREIDLFNAYGSEYSYVFFEMFV